MLLSASSRCCLIRVSFTARPSGGSSSDDGVDEGENLTVVGGGEGRR